MRIPFVFNENDVMGSQVSSFQQLVEFLSTQGLETESAVPIAERFMEAAGVDFDADGNFAPMKVRYEPEAAALKRE